jgi:hypothetical protein
MAVPPCNINHIRIELARVTRTSIREDDRYTMPVM